MNLRIAIAEALFPPSEQTSRAIREHLQGAMEKPERRPLPTAGMRDATVHVGARDLAKLKKLTPEGEPMARVASELIHGRLARDNRERSTPQPAAPPAAPDWMRPEQAYFYGPVHEGMEDGKIVLAEASTGVGKGRVIAQLALDYQQPGAGPVVVTAPSLGVLAALAREFQEHPEWETRSRGHTRFWLGANQYAHAGRTRGLAQRLKASESEEEQAAGDALEAWLNDGAPAGQTESTADFERATKLPLAHLMEDARTFIPDGIPAEELCLLPEEIRYEPSADDDPSVVIARRARQNEEQDGGVLFCTHALYGLHARSLSGAREPLLPGHATLIVDEAHQFETNIQSVLSDEVSLRSLDHLVHKLPRKLRKRVEVDIEEVEDAIDAMEKTAQMAPGEDQILFAADKKPEYHEVVARAKRMGTALERITQAVGRAREATYPGFETEALLRRALRTVRGMANGKSAIRVSASNVRGYLSIAAGAGSLRGLFTDVWESVDRAALVAATLLQPVARPYRARVISQKGYFSSEYIERVLALPSHRLSTPAPVMPDWVLGNLDPHCERDPETRPPSDRDHETEERFTAAWNGWLDHLAARILEVAGQEDATGTLVLMTAYRDIEGLEARLRERLGDRLITQSTRRPYSQVRHLFMGACRAGLRPVWLATGSAWVGTSLTVDGVSQVSDLVIARLPVGLNRSITQAARARGNGGLATQVTEATWMFRQGIGRMVRSPEDRGRRLWVLDPRPFTEKRYWAIRWVLEQAGCKGR